MAEERQTTAKGRQVRLVIKVPGGIPREIFDQIIGQIIIGAPILGVGVPFWNILNPSLYTIKKDFANVEIEN